MPDPADAWSLDHHADCDREVAAPRTYSAGDCQRLAAAIHRFTGWPVALYEGAGNHLAVAAPVGQHLDIHGLRDPAVIADEWEADCPPELFRTIDDLGWLGTDTCVCDLRAARDVLDQAGLLTAALAEVADWDIAKLADESP